MLSRIAGISTRILLRRNIITEAKRNIFIYGFELFYSTAFTIVSILVVGSCVGMRKETYLFLLFFMPIRMVAGGYHASTYVRCYFLTNTIFLFYLFLYTRLLLTPYITAYFFLFFISVIYICIHAPIVNIHHPISEKRWKQNKLWTYKIIIIESLIMVIVYISGMMEEVCSIMLTTIIVVFMMCVVRKEG